MIFISTNLLLTCSKFLFMTLRKNWEKKKERQSINIKLIKISLWNSWNTELSILFLQKMINNRRKNWWAWKIIQN